MISPYMNELLKQRRRLEDEMLDVQKRISAYKSLNSVELLAIDLHDMLCRHNHADGCGWHYEIYEGEHNWDKSEHVLWKTKAQKALDIQNGSADKVWEMAAILR